jgi:histidine triad (HIT) family protein
MEDCIFCKIVAGEIPCKKVYEDEQVLAFYDVNPAAPVHVLVIPKKHIRDITQVSAEDMAIVSAVILTAQKIVKEMNLSEDGFRVVINTGKMGGQTVPHLHFHILGGRMLAWPPD